jgi:hypothetical protein
MFVCAKHFTHSVLIPGNSSSDIYRTSSIAQDLISSHFAIGNGILSLHN